MLVTGAHSDPLKKQSPILDNFCDYCAAVSGRLRDQGSASVPLQPQVRLREACPAPPQGGTGDRGWPWTGGASGQVWGRPGRLTLAALSPPLFWPRERVDVGLCFGLWESVSASSLPDSASLTPWESCSSYEASPSSQKWSWFGL